MRTSPSFRHLENFLLIAQSHSFSDTARALRLTPSALSRNINQLETQLGVRLFERSTRAVILTAEGVEFVSTAQRILGRGLGHFEQFVSGQRGRITIAALPSVAVSLLAPLIAKFEQSHRGAEIFIHDTIDAGGFQVVQDGRADFGLTCSLQTDDDIRVEPLVSDGFFVLCRGDHPLAAKETVTWRELSEYRFIGSAPNSSARFYTDSAFAQAGVKVRNLYEPVGLPTMASLVVEGVGVTALPGLVVPIVELPGLVHRPLTTPQMVRQISLLTKISRPQSPLPREFARFLHRELRGGLLAGRLRPFAWLCEPGQVPATAAPPASMP